jgi:hypothetical protein
VTAERSDGVPFVGPRPFSAEESDVFFGRDREVDRLVSLVISQPAVLLYAVSGAGKTSLLSAGLIPELTRQGFDVLPTLRLRGPIEPPPDASNAYIYSALWRLSGAAADGEADEQPPDRDLTLSAALVAHPRGTDRYGFPSPRLLIFDQFEEVFTLHLDRWQEREGFFAQVGAALAEDPSLRVLFALREEYLAPLDRYGSLLPDGLRTRFHLERLRREAAALAVTGPLRRAGIAIDDEVAHTLVADLEQTRVDTGHGRMATVPGEYVEPVHLQVVCRTLWSRLAPGAKRVTPADLAVLGSVDQSLTAYYESAVAAAVERGGVREHKFREAFEDAFITSADTRAAVFASSADSGPLSPAALDELADRHVIRGEWRAGGRWLELAHDRLIEPIRRSNASVRERVRRRRLWLGAVAVVAVAAIAGGAAALFIQEEAPKAFQALTRYPGDDAPKADRARWMATKAIAQRLPPELPIMAALTESNLENLKFGDRDAVGYFQMSPSVWGQGKYKGFPTDPDLQLKWFFDQAKAVRRQRIEEGRRDPASSPRLYGKWIADVERPPEQYRGRYQLKLARARALARLLIAGGRSASAPAAPATEPAPSGAEGGRDRGTGRGRPSPAVPAAPEEFPPSG